MKYIKDIKRKLEWEKYYHPNFNWSDADIYSKHYLSEEFLNEFFYKVDWNYVALHQKISDEFLIENAERIDKRYRGMYAEFWHYVSAYQTLSENTIKALYQYVKWEDIVQYQKLSEQFIYKMIYKNSWFAGNDNTYNNDEIWKKICKYQTLSEKFIDKIKDKVDWFNISRYQMLSEKFIQKHKDNLSSRQLLTKYYLCKEKDMSEAYLSDKLFDEIIARYKASEAFKLFGDDLKHQAILDIAFEELAEQMKKRQFNRYTSNKILL